ncbi:MAG: DPP IV N-terminal domain-containing protein, partial [Fimbriimonadaceae bacterium]
MISIRFSALLVTLMALCALAPADDKPTANWPQANRYTNEFLRQFVFSSSVNPSWVQSRDFFWYSWKDGGGIKFYYVDPYKQTKKPLFDSAKMAAMLSEALKKPYDVSNLPITTITFDAVRNKYIQFTVDGTRFEYDLATEVLKDKGKVPTGPTPPQFGGFGGQQNREFRNWAPDKKGFVYAMDHNLYYVEVTKVKEKDKEGKEIEKDKEGDPIQLNKDGEKDYSFGSRDANREFQQFFQQGGGQGGPPSSEKRVRANVTWSEDSKKFFVVRGDSRKVKDLYLVNSLAEPRPTLLTYKYAMPGEENITLTELYLFDRDKKELKKLDVGKYKDQSLFDIHWPLKAKSDTLRFVRRDRLQRNLEFCEMDLATGKITPLITESVQNAFLERQNIRYLKAGTGSDMIWWSERSGWGHYYLYSFDGKLKNPITSGPWRAERIVELDDKAGRIWFQAVGYDQTENPYYAHLYKSKLDGTEMTLLDEGQADHNSTVSPKERFVVDTYSRADLAPVAVLRDPNGKIIMELEKMDLSKLQEYGWKLPETFKVKAADGVTDIYGNMWKPFDFDPKKKYPIIANVYPGPQTESVASTFSAVANNQRLAQLGFIVIQIGNRGGNPSRSNAYHSYGYYNLRDYGLADKKAGIEQLAAKYSWIDIDKVGIFGHSGGGFMTAAALLLPPYNNFFKVGVSSAGNHDNNIYNWNWSEQNHGLREVPVIAGGTGGGGSGGGRGGRGGEEPIFDEGFNYDALIAQMNEPQAAGNKIEIKVPTNQELAANLKGKLLLVHGDLDNNVHPGGTIKLVNALI